MLSAILDIVFAFPANSSLQRLFESSWKVFFRYRKVVHHIASLLWGKQEMIDDDQGSSSMCFDSVAVFIITWSAVTNTRSTILRVGRARTKAVRDLRVQRDPIRVTRDLTVFSFGGNYFLRQQQKQSLFIGIENPEFDWNRNHNIIIFSSSWFSHLIPNDKPEIDK